MAVETASARGNHKEFSIRMKRLSFSALFLFSATALVAVGQTAAAPKPAAPAAAVPIPTAKVAVIMFQAAVTQTTSSSATWPTCRRNTIRAATSSRS
jgi:hypothetical protein